MAYFRAYTAFNLNDINLNWYFKNGVDSAVYANSNRVFSGQTYADFGFVEGSLNFSNFQLVFLGTNINYNNTANGIQITGGTINVLYEIRKGLSNPEWYIKDISASALSVYNAGLTSGNTDDLFVVERALSGDDYFDMSAYDDVMNGYDGNDTMYGNYGNDTLNGGNGNDILIGGWGSDALIGGNGFDTIKYNDDGVYTSVTVDLITGIASGGGGSDAFTGIEAVVGSRFSDNISGDDNQNTLSGDAGDDSLFGRGGNDILYGDAGNDILDGGDGADQLLGGSGNDTYLIDTVSDVVTEQTGEGTDTIKVGFSYTLGANLENLTLTGLSAINGTGNAENNVLTGNDAANILDGGTGNDTMIGGGGNDTYLIDSTGDLITELATGGDDTVRSSVTYTLSSNVETLVLLGSAAINGTGSADANLLYGNSGDNRLTGGAGDDVLSGGAGNDVLDGGAGFDRVDYSNLTTNLDIDLTRTAAQSMGDADFDTFISIEGIIGGSGNDVLKGDANDNYLDGGAGADTMTGGAGNDTYVIDSTSDAIFELANEGIDTVRVSMSHALGANLENLTLIGLAAIDGTGNALSNTITGNAAANILDGGAGNDVLIGGGGDDVYIIDSVGDSITELANGGTDTVTSSVSYILASNVENLTLNGAAALNGTGNSDSNILTGNSADNRLFGGAGNDILVGGAGNNYLDGGSGVDAASFAGLTTDLEIDLSNFSGTITTALGTDTFVSIEGLIGGSGNDVLKAGTTATYLDGGAGNDFLGGSAFDDTLIGGGGDDGIAAGAGNDSLDGGDGDDTLLGQAGDDTISGGLGADFIDAGDGIDTVNAGDANDLINGGNGNDIINGDAGNDSIYGDAGNDVIDGGAGDDDLSGGNDNDTITGGAGDDRIAGGFGNDILNGGDGNDTISANDGDDTITGGLGVDNLYGFTGNDNIDGGDGNDTLLGMEGDDTITGGAGADYIVGGDGADSLSGDDGDDNMQGNDGNDTLSGGLGNDGLDGGAGNDTLNGDAGNDYLGGGEGNDILGGGDGNDVFVGGAGKDTLTGGAGADAFFFTALTDSTSAAPDKITDFSWADGDYIDLSRIDANTSAAGDQAFSFVNSFTKQAGQATLTYDAASNTSTFSADVDGDGVADFVLQVSGQQDTSHGWVL